MPPRLIWDCGTAYDLFISLVVLHQPEEYNLRASWAAGMRSRLPGPEREFFDQLGVLLDAPLEWVVSLPAPKDGMTALQALKQLRPADRLPALFLPGEDFPALRKVLQSVYERRTWDKADVEAARAAIRQYEKAALSAEQVEKMLSWWASPEEFGERYLNALRAYYEVFFAEEERRITPAITGALARARQLAEQLELPLLVQELSQGVHFENLLDVPEWVFAPSFWSAPLVFYRQISPERMLLVFGARPADASLVPGDAPDALMRPLKALSDSTRLRILRYLFHEQPLTPSQLSRRLRLRAPTVIHHLHVLRLAGLVQVMVGAGKERRYALRPEGIATTFAHLQEFLEKEE
jgi:DNA-binding transcriptional ArsR family regulator